MHLSLSCNSSKRWSGFSFAPTFLAVDDMRVVLSPFLSALLHSMRGFNGVCYDEVLLAAPHRR